jgi:hypothetical protein
MPHTAANNASAAADAFSPHAHTPPPQAEVCGEVVTWLVPHALSQVLPADVDYRVMLTFLEFYEARPMRAHMCVCTHRPQALTDRERAVPTPRRCLASSTSSCTTRWSSATRPRWTGARRGACVGTGRAQQQS